MTENSNDNVSLDAAENTYRNHMLDSPHGPITWYHGTKTREYGIALKHRSDSNGTNIRDGFHGVQFFRKHLDSGTIHPTMFVMLQDIKEILKLLDSNGSLALVEKWGGNEVEALPPNKRVTLCNTHTPTRKQLESRLRGRETEILLVDEHTAERTIPPTNPPVTEAVDSSTLIQVAADNGIGDPRDPTAMLSVTQNAEWNLDPEQFVNNIMFDDLCRSYAILGFKAFSRNEEFNAAMIVLSRQSESDYKLVLYAYNNCRHNNAITNGMNREEKSRFQKVERRLRELAAAHKLKQLGA